MASVVQRGLYWAPEPSTRDMTTAEFIYTVVLKPPPLRRASNALIRALIPDRVRVGSASVHLNRRDPVVSGALAFGVYERTEIAFFRSHFRRDMTLVDVGANVGLYTALALSTENFAGRVLAVEPHAESRRFLARTIEANLAERQRPRVVVSEKAASDRTGPVTLYLNLDNLSDNRLYPDPLLGAQTCVEADTLDNICREAEVDTAQFVKIDVQGAEALVLAGAASLLDRSRDCILMTEFWPYGLTRCGGEPCHYLERLRSHGFALYELLRQGRLSPIRDDNALISRAPGRHYATVIGFKGHTSCARA